MGMLEPAGTSQICRSAFSNLDSKNRWRWTVSSDVFPSTASIYADEPGVSSDIVDDGEAMNVD